MKKNSQGFRETEAELTLHDCIKVKPAISIAENVQCLQVMSHAMNFANSSKGNKPFTVRDEVG